MTIAQEEIFGPVIALIKADTLEEALETANDVKFGLSASILRKTLGGCCHSQMKSKRGSFASTPKAPVSNCRRHSEALNNRARIHGNRGGSQRIFTAVKTVFVKP